MRIVFLAALSCLGLFAQPTPSPRFEVASVRPIPDHTPSDVSSTRGGPGTTDPGRVTLTNQNLFYLVSYAFSYTFGGESYRIIRPDWLPSAYFTVTATLPPGTTKEQYRLMMENLLIDRFHMVAHHETKPLDAYEMTIGKNGPKLTPSSAADTALAEQTLTGPLLTGTKDAKGYSQLARPGMQGVGVQILALSPSI